MKRRKKKSMEKPFPISLFGNGFWKNEKFSMNIPKKQNSLYKPLKTCYLKRGRINTYVDQK
tara:strand:- start:309 stop:491 length:183 start_codon:yes stop_codon:yes gene_type:complete